MACAGDVPTLGDAGGASTCCASACPTLKVRVVNVVDLMRLQPAERASRTA